MCIKLDCAKNRAHAISISGKDGVNLMDNFFCVKSDFYTKCQIFG